MRNDFLANFAKGTQQNVIFFTWFYLLFIRQFEFPPFCFGVLFISVALYRRQAPKAREFSGRVPEWREVTVISLPSGAHLENSCTFSTRLQYKALVVNNTQKQNGRKSNWQINNE